MIADRQGDVVLIHMDAKSHTADFIRKMRESKYKAKPKNGRLVLAEGEVTGHAHTMDPKVAELIQPPASVRGDTILIVHEATAKCGDFIEGKLLETLKDGTLRFQQTDGVVARFAPGDVTVSEKGVKVKRPHSLLKHDEHDAIPLSKGAYKVNIHQTAVTPKITRQVVD